MPTQILDDKILLLLRRPENVRIVAQIIKNSLRARSVQPLYPQAVFDDTANMAVFGNIGCIVKYSVIRKYSEPNDFWRRCISTDLNSFGVFIAVSIHFF